jgi:hypothetical protein
MLRPFRVFDIGGLRRESTFSKHFRTFKQIAIPAAVNLEVNSKFADCNYSVLLP